MTRRAATWLLLLAELGCRSSAPEGTPAGDGACRSACAALVTACASDETAARQAACAARCREASGRAARAGCDAEHRAYLTCASTARVACGARTEPEGSALEHGRGLDGCAAAHAAYFSCTEPCREQGVVHAGVATVPHEGRELAVRAELVVEGCAEPLPARAKGAAPGSPCTHHTVCAAERCACGRKRPSYHARACVDGRCASPALACALAPRAVAYEPCP